MELNKALEWADKHGAKQAIDQNREVMHLLVAEVRRLQGYERDYNELIFAVGKKCPGENRHQTALRYIQEAESGSESGALKQALEKTE